MELCHLRRSPVKAIFGMRDRGYVYLHDRYIASQSGREDDRNPDFYHILKFATLIYVHANRLYPSWPNWRERVNRWRIVPLQISPLSVLCCRCYEAKNAENTAVVTIYCEIMGSFIRI